jgi:hypothetical protein
MFEMKRLESNVQNAFSCLRLRALVEYYPRWRNPAPVWSRNGTRWSPTTRKETSFEYNCLYHRGLKQRRIDMTRVDDNN